MFEFCPVFDKKFALDESQFYTTCPKDKQCIAVLFHTIFTPYQCCHFTQYEVSQSLLVCTRKKYRYRVCVEAELKWLLSTK